MHVAQQIREVRDPTTLGRRFIAFDSEAYKKYREGCPRRGHPVEYSPEDQLRCMELWEGLRAATLAKDRYWRMIGVYKPDVDGVAKWVSSMLQGGRARFTMYGSRSGKAVVATSPNLDEDNVYDPHGFAGIVESSFWSPMDFDARQRTRHGVVVEGIEIDPARAFTVSLSNAVEVGGATVLTRIVVDIDAVDLTQSEKSFDDVLRLVQLGASTLYAEFERLLGLKPLRNVLIYFSGSKGLHVEVMLPVSAMWIPACNRDNRPGLVLARYISSILPNASIDHVQILNMVSRVPFATNIRTGLPKVPLGEDGKAIDYLPLPEPISGQTLTKLLADASSIPVTEVCNQWTMNVFIGDVEEKRRGSGKGTIRAWDILVEAFKNGALPKLSDCRERFARMLGRWCKIRGLDEQQCLETFEQCVEDARRSYATYVRQGMREGEHLMPAHPEKIFCGQEWYSCQEVQLCDTVRKLLNNFNRSH